MSNKYLTFIGIIGYNSHIKVKYLQRTPPMNSKQETGEILEVTYLAILDESANSIERIGDPAQFPAGILTFTWPRRGDTFSLVQVTERRKVSMSTICGGPSDLREKVASIDPNPTIETIQRVKYVSKSQFKAI